MEDGPGEILVPGSPEPAAGSEDCQVYPGQGALPEEFHELGSEDGGGVPGGGDSWQMGQ